MKLPDPFIKVEYYDENKIINQVLKIPEIPSLYTTKKADLIEISKVTYIIKKISAFDLYQKPFINKSATRTIKTHDPLINLRQAIREAHNSGISLEQIRDIFLLENVEFIHDL